MRFIKCLAVTLCALLLPSQAFSALSAGVHTSAASGSVNSITTPSVTTQASGSAFYVMIEYHSGLTVTGVTDNKGNTYTKIGSTWTETSANGERWYCANGVGGTGHTFTLTATGTAALMQLIVGEITTTNGNGVTLDQQTFQQTTGSPASSPTVTTTVPNEILMGAMQTHSGSGTASFAGANSFTMLEQITDGLNDNAGCIGYRLVSSTGSYFSEFSVSGLTWSDAMNSIDTFSEAPGKNRSLLLMGVGG